MANQEKRIQELQQVFDSLSRGASGFKFRYVFSTSLDYKGE